jgi:hypothetical protein
MKATEEVNSHQKELEPILNNVEADLSKSKDLEHEVQPSVGESGPSMKEPSLKQQQSKVDIAPLETERNNSPLADM